MAHLKLSASACALYAILLVISLAQNVLEIGFSNREEENRGIYEVFNGVENGFFVNIGLTRAIQFTPIMLLKSQGWRGLNVDQNSKFLNSLFGMSRDDMNLNLVISAATSGFVDLPEDGSFSSRGTGLDLKVPAISYQQLCSRYFSVRPQLLAVEVDRIDYSAFRAEDWKEDICKPEVVMVTFNSHNFENFASKIRQFLEQNGYRPLSRVGFSLLFAHESSQEYYQRVSTVNREFLKANPIKFVDFKEVINAINIKNANGQQIDSVNYNPFTSETYLHFATKGDNLDFNYLSRYSEKIRSNQQLSDRPIMVFNFDARWGTILLSGRVSISALKIGALPFFMFEIWRNDRKSIICLLDHGYIGSQGLRITRTDSSDPGEVIFQQGRGSEPTGTAKAGQKPSVDPTAAKEQGGKAQKAENKEEKKKEKEGKQTETNNLLQQKLPLVADPTQSQKDIPETTLNKGSAETMRAHPANMEIKISLGTFLVIAVLLTIILVLATLLLTKDRRREKRSTALPGISSKKKRRVQAIEEDSCDEAEQEED